VPACRPPRRAADDIYVTPLDAEAANQVTTRRADDGQPAWSPDGRRIAFKTTQLGSNRLAVMNADGTGEALLTRTFSFSEGQPSWSLSAGASRSARPGQ
jgi:Tol biopolymer transport system component